MSGSGKRRYEAALAALDARTNYEASGTLTSPSLDRIRAVVELLNDPQHESPAIHITGTNGKTTCAFAATAMLRALGLTTGTYISPHLESPRERILYDGEPIGEEDFARLLEYLAPFFATVEERLGSRITWFEAVTALAFEYFNDKVVDAQVLEVGMGGRWDATNVADARVAVITEVALDHPELGSTPVEIASEKSGIVKPGAIVLTAERKPEVLAVIERRCAEVGAELRRLGEHVVIEERLLAVGGQRLAVRFGEHRYEDLFLPLYGERLAVAAVLGAAAALALTGDHEVEEEAVAEGFAAMRSPGRVEVVRRHPQIVVDGAHNPAAAAALADAMRSSFVWDRLIVVLGMLDDKDVEGVVAAIAPIASEVIAVPAASERSAPPERIERAAAAAGVPSRRTATIEDAVAIATEHAGDRDCVLVTGSFYTVGRARAALTRAAG